MRICLDAFGQLDLVAGPAMGGLSLIVDMPVGQGRQILACVGRSALT